MADLSRHRPLISPSISNLSDLEAAIRNPAGHTPDTLLTLINTLYDASNHPKPAIKTHSLRLLALLCSAHSAFAAAHLSRVLAHVTARLRDTDPAVRDAARHAIEALAALFLKGSDNGPAAVGVFVRPLLEVLGDQGKLVQVGAATCLAKVVECAVGEEAVAAALQKLCPRVCKCLNSHGCQAKAALLGVVSNLAQVRAIAQHNVPTLLQSIYDCLHNTDWATRKAAADALIALASHSSHLNEGTSMTIAALEACRFDKIKPVRDSMTEALQLWKKIKVDGVKGVPSDQNTNLRDEKILQMVESTEKPEPLTRDVGDIISSDSTKEGTVKGNGALDKAVGTLKKKVRDLTNKKDETKSSGDIPVEIIVPQKFRNSSNTQSDVESKLNETSSGSRSSEDEISELDDGHEASATKYQSTRREDVEIFTKQDSNGAMQKPYRGKHSNSKILDVNDSDDSNQRDVAGAQTRYSRINGRVKGNPKGSYSAIQRQLTQLERQQAHLMNMLQDFMGWSRDGMLTLENRVRGLERVVEDMERDLSATSGIRGDNFLAGLERSGVRPVGKYNRLPEYSTFMLRRDAGTRRSLAWRSNMSKPADSYSNGALINGLVSSRRTLGGVSGDGKPGRTENGGAQTGGRKAWDKGGGPIRLGEGPSARSVWRASKDEATLEAIRVAGEDNETYQLAMQSALPGTNAEVLENNGEGQDPEPIWNSWNNALDALRTGDVDRAYAEILSTGDDLLLAKLMYKSGPVIDHLSNEIANEVVLALGQFLVEQNLFEICLSWIQQLVETVMENGPDVFSIPLESKRELLLNLHEAASATDPPEDCEGSTPYRLMLQLASSWSIDLQQFER